MADPLSIAGSIAGLIALGIQTAKVLYDAADGIGSAGGEVRDVAEQVTNLSNVLTAVQEKIEQRRSLEGAVVTALRAAIKPCKRLLATFSEMLKPLQPVLDHYRDSRRKLEQIGLRVKWYIRTKNKVRASRDMLDRHLNCLQIALTTLSIPDASSGPQISVTLNSLTYKIAQLEAVHSATASAATRRDTDSRGSNGLLSGVGNTLAIAAGPNDNQPTMDNSTTHHRDPEVQNESENNVTDIVPLSRSLEPVVNVASEEIEEVYEQVDASLEEGLREMTDMVFMEIVLQTYTFEEVILEAAREVGAQPSFGSRTHVREASPMANSQRSARQSDTSPDQQADTPQADTTAGDVSSPNNVSWNVLTLPSGWKGKVPYSAVNTAKGLLQTILRTDRDTGDGFLEALFLCRGWTFRHLTEDGLNIMLGDWGESESLDTLERILRRMNLWIVDSDGLVTLLKYWCETIKPGMTIVFAARKGGPKKGASTWTGAKSRVSRLLGR